LSHNWVLRGAKNVAETSVKLQLKSLHYIMLSFNLEVQIDKGLSVIKVYLLHNWVLKGAKNIPNTSVKLQWKPLYVIIQCTGSKWQKPIASKKTSYLQKPHWLVFAFCLFIVIRLVKVIILSYIHYTYIGGISSISIIQWLTHLQASRTLLKIM